MTRQTLAALNEMRIRFAGKSEEEAEMLLNEVSEPAGSARGIMGRASDSDDSTSIRRLMLPLYFWPNSRNNI